MTGARTAHDGGGPCRGRLGKGGRRGGGELVRGCVGLAWLAREIKKFQKWICASWCLCAALRATA